jgi:hypothetical protein
MRRIRGEIGMGFTWGAAWSVAGFALAAMMRFKADAPFPIIFGALGFLAGVIFSASLSVAANGRSFEEMSVPRLRRGVQAVAFCSRSSSRGPRRSASRMCS